MSVLASYGGRVVPGERGDVGTAVVLIVIVGLNLVFWSAIVSASRIDAYRWGYAGRSKGATIFLLFVTGGIGALYYWLRLRPQLLADSDT